MDKQQQIKDLMNFLLTHNKNYTKKQYYALEDLQELLNKKPETNQKAKYSIGTKFVSQGKRKDTCNVIDIHYTYNAIGEYVNHEYIAESFFMGQRVISKHSEMTLDRAKNDGRIIE